MNDTVLTACRQTTTRPKGYKLDWRPQQKTQLLLNAVDDILAAYRAYMPLTLRQVYYLLVARDLLEKTDAAYERLSNHLSMARRAKRIPFSAIRDDGIAVADPSHWADEDDFLSYMRDLGLHYKKDKLANQDVHIDVWCEAKGMIPQLARVAEKYSVKVYSSSGFDSLTAKYDIVERVCRIGKHAKILHLGDCDPSGVSLFESAAEDVARFVEADKPHGYCSVEFIRVALTRDMVGLHHLSTVPAKSTDSRSKGWEGGTCQLEALPPEWIARYLDSHIRRFLDLDQLAEDYRSEEMERQQIIYALPAPRGEVA